MIPGIVVFVIGWSVMSCLWRPGLWSFEPYKLASIMYLYDKGVCALDRDDTQTIQNLKLSADTKGFNVLPIRWVPAEITVSARLSEKTRTYVQFSVVFHIIWMILTVAFRCIVKSNKNTTLLNISIKVYFYLFVFTAMFDLSMALVYITHIKKAITKGMITRHSGWSVEMKFLNNDDFAGYLPMAAAAVWMRGVIILALNIWSCKKINDIRLRIKEKLVLTRIKFLSQQPLPDAIEEQNLESNKLYYRPGEKKPYVHKFYNMVD